MTVTLSGYLDVGADVADLVELLVVPGATEGPGLQVRFAFLFTYEQVDAWQYMLGAQVLQEELETPERVRILHREAEPRTLEVRISYLHWRTPTRLFS